MTTEYEKRQRKEAIERIKVAQQKHRATLQAERDEAKWILERYKADHLVKLGTSCLCDICEDTRKFLEGIK